MYNIKPYANEDTLVAQLSEVLALTFGINPDNAKLISGAVALHDIGKVWIPKYILCKPEKLLPCEFEIMKNHTLWGASILSGLHGGFGTVARNICMLHHENWDGTGYWGLKGGEFPYYCQIASICDVYVALTVQRAYKEPWLSKDALEYIKNQAGKQFCPILVDVFLSLFTERGFECRYSSLNLAIPA